MKRPSKIIPALAVVSGLTALFAASNARANEFTGSLAFSAAGITTDNSVLSNATTFTVIGGFTTAETGEYALLGVTDFTPVTFDGFKFNPPVGSVSPLWTFNMGPTVLSFDTTSMLSTWVPGIGGGEWVITGNGLASISGFTDTPGTYTVNLSDSGNLSVGFDSTAATPLNVPDGGNTMTLLGGALIALGAYARKFA